MSGIKEGIIPEISLSHIFISENKGKISPVVDHNIKALNTRIFMRSNLSPDRIRPHAIIPIMINICSFILHMLF